MRHCHLPAQASPITPRPCWGLLRRHGSVEPGARRADIALYHLGNNQLHRKIYRRALAKPGVVVLHDAVLHHFFLGSLDRAEYVERICL